MVISLEPCEVNINGEDWYIPCDRTNDLFVSDEGLINVSSSNLTLYDKFVEDSSNYPRLVCNYGRVCYIQNSNYNDIQYVSSVSEFEVLKRSVTDRLYDSYFSIFILGVLLLWYLSRR